MLRRSRALGQRSG